MATLQLIREDKRKKESTYLSNFAKNVASQEGEDGIIEKIFEIIGTKNKWCVEFGAHNGHTNSNTWNLINNAGWRSIQIEGDAPRFAQLKDRYKNNQSVITINTFVQFEGENSLDAILERSGAPVDLDFISIDIDGNDFHIWASLTKFRPRLVVIEFNQSIPSDILFVQDKNTAVNQGSSLRAFIELGKSKNYELVATTAGNAFFVLAEDFPKFGIKDNSIDSMHFNGIYESRLFQLFDGTLVICGCQALIWKQGFPITQRDIQVLPDAMRRFGVTWQYNP